MTVGELIEKLRSMPQDLRVVVESPIGDALLDAHIEERWALIGKGSGNLDWVHRPVDSTDTGAELVILIDV
jgi:hypothetical protein